MKPISQYYPVNVLTTTSQKMQITFLFKSKPSYYMSKRTMLTTLQKNSVNMLRAKQNFLFFCDHLKNMPKNNVDQHAIISLLKTLENNSFLCERPFQLAMEVTYNKKGFNREYVLQHFSKFMEFNRYSEYTEYLDQSTVHTALQNKLLKERYPKWDLTVNETPPSNIPATNLPPKIQSTLDLNKALTENRFPDAAIDGLPFDYKFTKTIAITKNQIYIMPETPEALKAFTGHLITLNKWIDSNPQVSREFRKIVITKANQTLLALTNEPKTLSSVIDNWNIFLISTASQRPSGIGIPIFFITNKPEIKLPVDEINKVIIPEGTLDYVKAKQAMIGIVQTYSEETQNNIYQATKGALGHLFTNDIN